MQLGAFIVFSSVRELPDNFVNESRQFTNFFLRPSEELNRMKVTLTHMLEGFGIGLHKHNALMFMLFSVRRSGS